MVAQPHYLLFCNTHFNDGSSLATGGGRWHFVLEQLNGTERLEAADSEPALNRERLALLSVVRGLEALEQPSQVTLVTTSRYVDRGLRYGLNSWREADYMWERFGEQRPVRNSDLWRRIDAALQFHAVRCRLIQAGPLEVVQANFATAQIDQRMAEPVPTSPRQTAARPLPLKPAGSIWLPPAALASLTDLTFHWWSLAAAWLRWWRGRMQAKPAFYGT